MPTTETDAELAIRAAQAGAHVVRDMFGSPLERHAKEGTDFATSADVEAERTILQMLRSSRPDDAITAEESGDSGAPQVERRWLVDPLCGTLNYATGGMLVAVNVALQQGADTVAAAVADPFSGEVFWTDGAAGYVRVGGLDRPLVASGESILVDVNLDPPFPNSPGFLAVALLADEGLRSRFRPRVVSTSLAVAWVAAGRRAAYVTDGDLLDSVHFTAGVALCRAAGCVVTDLQGQPLHSGTGGLIAAADVETHTALLDMIHGL